MRLRSRRPRRTWLDISGSVKSEPAPGVYGATFDLASLEGRGALKPGVLRAFRRATGLGNFTWRALWRRGAVAEAGGRREFLRHARGVIIFLHGWDGTGAIWEGLPAHVCAAERDCLVLVPDVNGFGGSPFASPEGMSLAQCHPAANMRAIEKWLATLGLLGGRRRYPIMLVGHSMGGATLFYLNERLWARQAVARCAIAPALLANDVLRQGFYRALGAGIWAGSKLSLDRLEERLAPMIITQLIAGASKAVQAEHRRVFRATSKQTLAATFHAMGLATRPRHGRRWRCFRVLLGHADRLVGVNPMLNLLVSLGFTSGQVRVLLGDHYFFSVSRKSQRLHKENRDIVLADIRALAAECMPAP